MLHVKTFLIRHPKTILFCLGCLSALAMAPVYAWPLMVIGYSTLLYYLVKTTHWKTASIYGFVFFFGYFLTSLYWISNSLFVELDRWWWALPLSFAGLPFLLSLFPTFFIGIASYAPNLKALAYILALIIADLARSHLFTGFPWNLPVHTWAHNDLIMSSNLLPNFGLYGVNSLTIIALILPYFTLVALRHKKTIGVISIILYTALFFYNASIEIAEKQTNDHNIVMIQGNIAQKDKWDTNKIWDNFDRYITMSKDAITTDEPHIIIWPETAISQYLIEMPRGHEMFSSFLSNLPQNSVLITGILTHQNNNHFNSIHVYNTQGDILGSYDKHHLVPFGEYMPFGLETITGVSGFTSGNVPNHIYIKHANFSFLPLICYESLFPHYIPSTDNSRIILNLTNDAWFGQTAGPYQHFDHMIFRAVETEKIAIRLSGNGISGYINSNGQIQSVSALNKQKTIFIKKNKLVFLIKHRQRYVF
jgi:apolipoprotein N-acyltransferase